MLPYESLALITSELIKVEVDWLICSQPWRSHEIDYYSSYLKYVVHHSFLVFNSILKTKDLWIISKKKKKEKKRTKTSC